MTENQSNENTKRLVAELHTIQVLADMPDEHLAWMAEKVGETRVEPGEVFVRPGDPADMLFLILEGEIRFQLGDGPNAAVVRMGAGHVTGLLPYSRLTQYPGTGQAVLPTRIAHLHKEHFPEMLRRMPDLGPRLVAIMADRIRESTRVETQRDKLAALGKLSAGLAHELNNPAAAARRATASLRETLETVRDASIRLARHALTQDQREMIINFEREAGHNVAKIPADPLAQSDREEQITSWLEGHHVAEAWKISPILADMDVDIPKLDSLAAEVGNPVLCDALLRITSLLTIGKLIDEIENSSKRISELVRAVKEYTYMDQAAMQEVDIHQGLESTLTILGHQLKRGVTVVREYDKELPKITAFGGELNQVWTNLIHNAIEAMHGNGELRLTTRREFGRVIVEVQDNGPGIPADVQPRIFDPFFTTKGIGEGTGLGLDTVCRIIRNHHGEIRVVSKPGDTRFQVYLPITQKKSQPASS